jgi:hypothetical protein
MVQVTEATAARLRERFLLSERSQGVPQIPPA